MCGKTTLTETPSQKTGFIFQTPDLFHLILNKKIDGTTDIGTLLE